MLFWITWVIAYPLLRLLFPLRYRGRENIPKGGGLILCSNHTSIFDPVFLMLSYRHLICFMAKEELFKNKFAAFMLRKYGVFAVKRGSGDKDALNVGADIIGRGKIMGIFPEGGRAKDYTPKRAKLGAAYIAGMAKADIIPACVYSKGKIKLFKKTTIRFGPVIKYDELGIVEGSMAEYKAAATLIMDRIKELWSMGHGDNAG